MEAAGIAIRPVITIVADATLLPSMFKGSMLFDKDVVYIYHKQLEEADIILVNKKDLVPAGKFSLLMEQVRVKYPGKPVLAVSNVRGDNQTDSSGINEWLDLLRHFDTSRRISLNIDYDSYGAGEAALAWFDQEIVISSLTNNAAALGYDLANKIFTVIQAKKWLIGHLKFFIYDDKNPASISFTAAADHHAVLKNSIAKVEQKILINARVQTGPEKLADLIRAVYKQFESQNDCVVQEQAARSFKPGYPQPVHRIQ